MSTPLVPKVTPRSKAQTIAFLGHAYAILADGEDTGGAYALIDAAYPPGDPGPPPHTHTREDEAFYLLEGEALFTVGDRQITAAAGSFVFAPRGIRHTFRNAGSGPLRTLVLVTPAGFERFVREIGEDWTGRTDPPPPPTPEQIQKLLQTAPKYGIEIHLPENP